MKNKIYIIETCYKTEEEWQQWSLFKVCLTDTAAQSAVETDKLCYGNKFLYRISEWEIDESLSQYQAVDGYA